MEFRFLKGVDFERLITEEKFKIADSIDDVHLLHLKHYKELFVKIPSQLCEKNPRDCFTWSKTKFNKDKKVEYRHQPSYSKLELFGEKVTCLKCTDFNNDGIHKQVIAYQDFTYVYYFVTSLGDIDIYNTSNSKSNRMDKATKEQLQTNVLPMRTVSDAVKVARGMGLSVSRKQVANLARNTTDVIFRKTGPRSKTTLKMVEELKALHPDNVWFETNSANLLSDFTFIRVFDEGCRIYIKSCPGEQRWEDWIKFVDGLQHMSETTRKNEIKSLLTTTPNGVFFPCRLHVDTTFNLGDVYVTIILGETGNFKTKSSSKPRVIPLAYMLHSSKRADNHQKFASALKDVFEKLQDSTRLRRIPCVLLDGESSLEHYPEILNAPPIRCDVHILSLLRFNYGGKLAAAQAKPFLFGRMKDGKWKCGLLACFDENTFNTRLRHIEKKIDPRIFDWLHSNKKMLMESSSAIAKLRAGHILQYSTNNQNETFNGILKATLSRRCSVPELIRKLDRCYQEKHRECWLSAIDGSEYVYFSTLVDEDVLADRIAAYSSTGLISCRILALNVPLKIAEAFDLQKLNREELACENLRLLSRTKNSFHLEDTSLDDDDHLRFIHVKVHDDYMIDCWKCVITLPAYICSHVIFALCQLEEEVVDAYWNRISGRKCSVKAANAFPQSSGMKLSDRIGSKQSARNHVRTITDISNITLDTDLTGLSGTPLASPNLPPSPSTPTASSDLSALSGTPLDSPNLAPSPSTHTPSSIASSATSERRSIRSRRPRQRFSPSYISSSEDSANDTGLSTVF